MATPQRRQNNYRPFVIGFSILIVLTVTALAFIPQSDVDTIFGMEITVLPLINAILNGITFVFLVLAWIAARRRARKTHERLIMVAVVLTALFFVSYVTYHFLASSTPFGGEGWLRYTYFFILASHILCAISVLPLALFGLFTGLNKEIRRHRRITRWAMPIWLYVSLSGVIVYLLISPYY